jgi:hypothetical protein
MTLQHLQALSTTGPILPGETRVTKNNYVPGEQVIAALSNVVYVVPNVALKGSALIDHSKLYPSTFPSKSDLVAASGHVRPDGKLSFVSFYEALLEAKVEADPNFHVTIDEATEEDKEYDELSRPLQKLYDSMHSRFGEKWDHAEIMEFLQLLSDNIGILTLDDFDNAFHSVVDNSWKWEAEFAEEYMMDVEPGLRDSMVLHAIDWQAVWDHSVTYDFHAFDFNGDVYVFYSNW